MQQIVHTLGTAARGAVSQKKSHQDSYDAYCVDFTRDVRFLRQDAVAVTLEHQQDLTHLYHTSIYPRIAAPFMFGDGVNTSFAHQYQDLQSAHPAWFARARAFRAPISTLMLAQHCRLGRFSPARVLPAALYQCIEEYARHVHPHDLILRAMALASSHARHLYRNSACRS